jgi:hypothetical protein
MRYAILTLVAIASAIWVHANQVKTVNVALVPGTYEILFCNDACTFADQSEVIVKGRLVLFANPLSKDELGRFNEARMFSHASDEAINGCFDLQRLKPTDSYVGGEKIGLTTWSEVDGKITFNLFHSPDAFYIASLNNGDGELVGEGASAGAGMGAPRKGLAPDRIVAKRVGFAQLDQCVFETAEEAKLAKLAKDPIRHRMGELERLYRIAMVHSLSQATHPRDWALAALMDTMSQADDELRASWITRAAHDAPDDVLVQWIALAQSKTLVAPNDDLRETALKNLQRIEPKNAAVWGDSLSDAATRQDADGAENALSSMASSTLYDEHTTDFLKAQLEVYKRYPLADDYFRLVSELYPTLTPVSAPYYLAARYATAVISVNSSTPVGNMFQLCAEHTSSSPIHVREQQCARIGRLMTAPTSSSKELRIGAEFIRQSGLVNATDINVLRNDDWIEQQYQSTYRATVIMTIDPPVEESVAYIKDWCASGSDRAAKTRALLRVGKPAEPPANWIDAWSPFQTDK